MKTLNEIKAKIHAQMALYSLKNATKDFQNAGHDMGKAITNVKKSLSDDGKAAYAELEKKAESFYNALPEASKKQYNEFLSKVEDFKTEIKNLTPAQVEEMSTEDIY